ncbi:hypothetical protein BJ973_002102 [Actinoplanes tereljensis]|uniref:Lipoprotein n=1 Tax=Paractinoplanes tereljensis TaxID=571912 RepID=A0A919NKT3_9ACTN|nr:hypothetical protein [Actinoplanes tereljensis]GIF19993.1 hypothetical protein Ate02nite_27230 [Actinoplanes tereljensis]
MIKRQIAGALVAACAAAVLAGCGFDAICGGDDYPVLQVGGTGRQCVPKSDEPPAGFARFPADKEPKHVDDEWDVYWRAHTLNESGTIEAA